MYDTPIAVVGNLVNDPEPRTAQSGLVFTTFRLASTPRHFDRGIGDYKDGETLFVSVICWRGLARNVAASLRKGDRVIVTGRLTQRNYEKEGQPRSAIEVDAQAIGPDLNRGVVRHERISRQPVAEPDAGAPTDVADPPAVEESAVDEREATAA